MSFSLKQAEISFIESLLFLSEYEYKLVLSERLIILNSVWVDLMSLNIVKMILSNLSIIWISDLTRCPNLRVFGVLKI